MKVHINEWVASRVYVDHPKCKNCKWLTEGTNKDGSDFLYCVGSPDYKTHDNATGEIIYYTKEEKPFLKPDRTNKDYGCYEIEIEDHCHDVLSDGQCNFVDIFDVTGSDHYSHERLVKKWEQKTIKPLA